MASRRSASSASASTARRRSGRSSSSSKSNQMPMVLIGIGALVVVVLLVVLNRGSGDQGADSQQQQQQQPAKPAHQPVTNLAPGSARGGKTPGRPAPTLSMEALEKVRGLLQQAKESVNEGVKLRTAGKNQEAREANSAAKAKIDELKALIEGPLDWHGEAEINDWAQPAEYVTLGKLYPEISGVENRARKGGGTR